MYWFLDFNIDYFMGLFEFAVGEWICWRLTIPTQIIKLNYYDSLCMFWGKYTNFQLSVLRFTAFDYLFWLCFGPFLSYPLYCLFYDLQLLITSWLFACPFLSWPLYCLFYDLQLLITSFDFACIFPYLHYNIITSQSFPHSWLVIRYVTRLTRRVPLVEQELLTLPEHLSSHPVLVGFVLLDLFILFLLDIVLSVLLRYTDSDYLFGVFKLFLQHYGWLIIVLLTNFKLLF